MTKKELQNASENKKILREGYMRKGGNNSSTSQVQSRPAAPAAIHLDPKDEKK